MFNQKNKEQDNKNEELKKENENEIKLNKIIKFAELYDKQLNYFRKRFNKSSQKHKVSIVTYKNSFDFTFVNLQEAKLYYEDLLKKWKSDVFIKLCDNKTIGTSCITTIEFVEGNHPEEYTQIEIDEWADEKVRQEMKKWLVVDAQLEMLCLMGDFDERWVYNLEKKESNIYRIYT